MSEFNDRYIVTPLLPEYMTPFDNGYNPPDYREQLEAAAILHDTAEAKILETMHGLTPASKNAGVYSGLSLDSFNFQGKPIKIEILSADTTAYPHLPLYTVSIFDGPRRINGDSMQIHHYSIPDMHHSDIGVTRRDVTLSDDPPERSVVRSAVSPDDIKPISSKAIEALIEILEGASEVEQLERDMGLNGLPVGLSEARAVALFIARGQCRVSLPNYTKSTFDEAPQIE